MCALFLVIEARLKFYWCLIDSLVSHIEGAPRCAKIKREYSSFLLTRKKHAMKTNLKTTGIELTEALSDYVDEKMAQIEKFVDPNDESVICDVEIGVTTKHHQSGEIFRAEINMHIAGGDFRAESEKEDLYVAINDAKEQIGNAIKEFRNKERGKKRRGAGMLKNLLKGFRS